MPTKARRAGTGRGRCCWPARRRTLVRRRDRRRSWAWPPCEHAPSPRAATSVKGWRMQSRLARRTRSGPPARAFRTKTRRARLPVWSVQRPRSRWWVRRAAGPQMRARRQRRPSAQKPAYFPSVPGRRRAAVVGLGGRRADSGQWDAGCLLRTLGCSRRAGPSSTREYAPLRARSGRTWLLHPCSRTKRGRGAPKAQRRKTKWGRSVGQSRRPGARPALSPLCPHTLSPHPSCPPGARHGRRPAPSGPR